MGHTRPHQHAAERGRIVPHLRQHAGRRGLLHALRQRHRMARQLARRGAQPALHTARVHHPAHPQLASAARLEHRRRPYDDVGQRQSRQGPRERRVDGRHAWRARRHGHGCFHGYPRRLPLRTHHAGLGQPQRHGQARLRRQRGRDVRHHRAADRRRELPLQDGPHRRCRHGHRALCRRPRRRCASALARHHQPGQLRGHDAGTVRAELRPRIQAD